LNILRMRTPGKLLIYTEEPTFVKLSLKPFKMDVHSKLINEGQLKITLNNLSSIEVNLKSEMITETVLQLRRDFNIIGLEHAAGSLMPSELCTKKSDIRSLNVASYSIEITSIAVLKQGEA
jgi:hypothetical protein